MQVLEAAAVLVPSRLPAADLVIDAAYGTGLSRPYTPPDPGGAPVLAVDIPSGLSGLTGCLSATGDGAGGPRRSDGDLRRLQAGPVVGDGPDRSGEVEVADIGLGPLVGRGRHRRGW